MFDLCEVLRKDTIVWGLLISGVLCILWWAVWFAIDVYIRFFQ